MTAVSQRSRRRPTGESILEQFGMDPLEGRGSGAHLSRPRQVDEARKAAARAGTRHTRRFLDQIASDGRLTGLAARVAIALTAFYNHEEGCARPAQETLAGRVGATRNGVAKALVLLRETGHIEVEGGRGRQVCNRYRLTLWSGSTS